MAAQTLQLFLLLRRLCVPGQQTIMRDTGPSRVESHLLLNISYPSTSSVLQVPSLPSQCVPGKAASSAKTTCILWMRQNATSCQVKSGHSALVSTDRVWNIVPQTGRCWSSTSWDTIASLTLWTSALQTAIEHAEYFKCCRSNVIIQHTISDNFSMCTNEIRSFH